MTTNAVNSRDIPSILIVDDAFPNLELLSGMLREWGYEPRPVPSGKLALQAAQADPPDLVLLDINMPEMDGFQVCAQLKADARLKDIPVIFITASSETASKMEAFSRGAVDYVTKPFQLEEVHARVHTHLEICRQKRELQQSYDKLAEMEQLRDSLVHMIVHDMRSPLSAIHGYLDLVKDGQLPNDSAHYVDQAAVGTRMLLAMVSSLLDVSKLEAGQMPLVLSAVDLRSLAEETIRLIKPLQGQRRILCSAHVGMDAITGDASLLGRVLHNLLGNAVKFTDKNKGIIAVGIEITPEDTVRVSIDDNGPGIPLEYREKVFDKFYQAAACKQGQVSSTGLGLTFCKLAVEAHGGRIGMESEVGQGSTFWFELPRR